MNFDILIIGAGPAGCSAAIYCARFGFKTVIVGGSIPGGQLLLTSEIENYAGVPKTSGAELVSAMHKQCADLGVQIIPEDVVKMGKTSPFTIETNTKKTYTAKAVIVASGVRTRWIGAENEGRLIGKGVSSCATCDGFFYRGKDVCVVGGGDTATEEAIFLSKFVNKVTIIHRRDKFKAQQVTADAVVKNPKITVEWDSVVKKIIGGDSVSAVHIANLKSGTEKEIPVNGVFVAVGHLPNTAFVKDVLEIDDEGYIKSCCSTTNIKGIFTAGDVANPLHRQAIVAAGTGCVAALQAEKFLNTHH